MEGYRSREHENIRTRVNKSVKQLSFCEERKIIINDINYPRNNSIT
jgi:hypothetical protein